MKHYFGKFITLNLIQLIFVSNLFSQNITNSNLSNIARRIYKIEKFEGVRYLEDNAEKYLLISVKIEKKNLSESTLSTIANVKAKSELNKFQNGVYINSEIIIITGIDSISKNTITSEQIKEYSSGFVKGVTSLTTLKEEDSNTYVFFFYVKI